MQFILEINKFDNYRKLSKIMYFDFDNYNICHKLVLLQIGKISSLHLRHYSLTRLREFEKFNKFLW